MKLEELFSVISGKTDIDLCQRGMIIYKIKHDDNIDDVPPGWRKSVVSYLTAVDYRTIEIGIE